MQYCEVNGVVTGSISSAAPRHHRLDRDLTLGSSINNNMLESELLKLQEDDRNAKDEDDGNQFVKGKRHRTENNDQHVRNSLTFNDDNSNNDNNANSGDDEEESEMDDYEKIMAEMAAKHERDTNDERSRKVARYEQNQRKRFDCLIKAL